MTRVTTVLGIDPGTRRTGYGVVEVRDGALRHVSSGVISPPARAELAERLLVIHRDLATVVAAHRPDAVAVEDIFFARHAKGALALGHARGVALLAASLAGIPVHSYPPARVKRALSGHGRADKGQIARLVSMLLHLPPQLAEDRADALSIAICHAAAAGWLVR